MVLYKSLYTTKEFPICTNNYSMRFKLNIILMKGGNYKND